MSETQIKAAIEAGELKETHYFDVKREVGDTDGMRKDFARNAASFAIDGGQLLIGVEEIKAARTWKLAPQPLAGLAEKVERILAQVVDPPLPVTTREFDSVDNPTAGLGYLVVNVMPSPVAPHMVDGVYYGRNDRTKYRLSDAEVLRLHARREPLERTAINALKEEIERDHVMPGHRTRGHLYAVAQPLTAPPSLSRSLLASSPQTLVDVARGVEHLLPSYVQQLGPPVDSATEYTRRAQGAALRSWAAAGPGRTINPADNSRNSEERLLDIEFREDGGLRLLMGRMTYEDRRSFTDEARQYIMDGLALAYVFRMVHWAASIATRTGYHGAWALGVHADRLRGLSSWTKAMSGSHNFTEATLLDAADYRQVTTASYFELIERPQSVVERLAGRLLRALGTEEHFGDVLRPTEPQDSTS